MMMHGLKNKMNPVRLLRTCKASYDDRRAWVLALTLETNKMKRFVMLAQKLLAKMIRDVCNLGSVLIWLMLGTLNEFQGCC